MNFIGIKEAASATGKSDKTIRRLLVKNESKPYFKQINGRLLIEVNYLFSCYPALKKENKNIRQKVDKSENVQDTLSLIDEVVLLRTKVALTEQEIKYKDELLAEKEGRIVDLQKAMLLLGPPAEQPKKKKNWWSF